MAQPTNGRRNEARPDWSWDPSRTEPSAADRQHWHLRNVLASFWYSGRKWRGGGHLYSRQCFRSTCWMTAVFLRRPQYVSVNFCFALTQKHSATVCAMNSIPFKTHVTTGFPDSLSPLIRSHVWLAQTPNTLYSSTSEMDEKPSGAPCLLP